MLPEHETPTSLRAQLRQWLGEGARCRDAKAAALCGNLLQVEPALWTFLYREDVEPTNNHMERLLRRAVLWRRRSFGSWSEAGCRFVGRVLTVVQTLRLQGRQVWQFLQQSLTAYRAHQPAPSLLHA